MTETIKLQRDAHYLATVEKTRCVLCVRDALAVTHGIGRDPETRTRLGDEWWNDDRATRARTMADSGR